MASGDRRVGVDLEREEPREPSLDDVAYWLAIYDELILFTEEMLALTRKRMAQLPGPAQRHLERTNVDIMEEELSTFRERTAVLTSRRDQLRSGG
jgi:hypothetical protein